MKPSFAAAAVALLSVGVIAGGVLPAGASTSAPNAVGIVTLTFVDRHRSTPAWNGQARQPERTLVTTVLYPAVGSPGSAGPVSGAAPDRSTAPYPLIVFAHGFGATPQDYENLLTHWASQGYVVAAPLFPLTHSGTPGGLDEGDIANQPGDMSFVITSALTASRHSTGTLAGMIDARAIGAAGHSNGAITTLGLVANTCCHDARVTAAVVLAGQENPFTGGHVDYQHAPPLLLVHGTADADVPYSDAEMVFNHARGPKALLTIEGGDHTSAAGFEAPSATSVLGTTTDFFDAYLKRDPTARGRLSTDQQPGITTMHAALAPGSTVTITTTPTPKLDLHATVTPHQKLTNGQQVTITWSGYTPGATVNLLQCSGLATQPSDEARCGFANAVLLQPDPTGSGSLPLTIVIGRVGDGICDGTHPCTILVNNAGHTDPANSIRLPISFAAA